MDFEKMKEILEEQLELLRKCSRENTDNPTLMVELSDAMIRVMDYLDPWRLK